MDLETFVEITCESMYNIIYYYIDDKTGKKCPHGEKNNKTKEEIIKSKKQIAKPPKTKKTDGLRVPLSNTEIKSIQQTYSIYMKHITDFYCIDVDDSEIHSMEDFIKKTKIDLFKKCCWIEGNTKGIHIYLKVKNMPQYSNQQKVFKDFEGDFIKKNNVWEKLTKKIMNYDGHIETFEFETISRIFVKKIAESVEKQPNDQENGVTTQVEVSTPINDETTKNWGKFEKLADLYSEQRIQNYDSWLLWTMAIKECFGNQGKDLWRKISKQHGEKSRAHKPNGNYDEHRNDEMWVNLKSKKKDKLGFGSLVYWAKEDNLEKYEELFGKQIDWVTFVSEAGFAKAFKEIIFKNKRIIFVGKEKQPKGYLYDGKIWRELSFSENEIKQKNFDRLYTYYMKTFYEHKPQMKEEDAKIYFACIQSLNKRLTRDNVVRLFVTECYTTEEPNWNNNCDIFAFNDALFCLNQKRILKDDEIDPQWYINYTCGYDYYIPNLNETDITNAKEYIMTILHNTLNPDNVDYVLKVVASFLKQSNPEEKAYFWLGRGRNGKGTITELIRNSLGKYWGELEMSNYTEKESGKNAPNQNLYDNQYSRVLNSSETDDDGDKTARFRSDFFKRITGGDYILARAVGKGDTVAYTAGKVLIQTNKMPYFAVMDAALKGRIIVIEFPYTFTDDVECIAQNPQKYKLKDPNLKHVFKQPVYRKAMFEIMFENYQKEAIIVPESVKQHTKSYFEEESVVSWVRQNYRLATEKEIQDHKIHNPKSVPSVALKTIKIEYASDTDKKLSVKTLVEQLQDNGDFDINTRKGFETLVGYVKIHLYESDNTIELIDFDDSA